MSCGDSLFGPGAQFIKTNAGDLIAVDGANTRERLILSDLRIPYKQILKSRVILKAGQVNYLLNHLGLGDNATFLSIKAVYSEKSYLEADNYIQWSFYDSLGTVNYLSQMMLLTGNSSNRIKQIYLSNPNINYPVYLDILVAVIDDNYSFFNDSVNQSATTFTGLEYTDIKTHIVGESIVVYDKNSPKRPLIYITLSNINSVSRIGNIITIDDTSLSTILLQFLTENDAAQAQSILNYVLENSNVDIDNISPLEDIVDPILYFYSQVGGIGGTGSYIDFGGSTASVPYNTSYGLTFSTSISLTTYGNTSSVITKESLNSLLISGVSDSRDGTMSITSSNILLSTFSLIKLIIFLIYSLIVFFIQI